MALSPSGSTASTSKTGMSVTLCNSIGDCAVSHQVPHSWEYHRPLSV